MDLQRYEQQRRVAEAEIDQLGHVNNVVYLQWIQEIAIAHWNALAPEEEKQTLIWVVTRHEIDYKRPAFRDDELIVRTWVGKTSGLLFERHTEILNAASGTLLVKGRTQWCPIDVARRRPTNVSDEVRRRFSVESGE